MKAQYHALTGGIAAAALIPVLGPYSAVFFASSVLVDGDHYLDYLCRNGFKDYSVKRMFVFHEKLFAKGKEQNFLGLNIGHTVEWMLLVYAASAITDWIWLKAALWGMLFHLFLDLVYLYLKKRLTRRAISIIEYFIRWNNMKRKGLQPGLFYLSTLQTMFGSSKGKIGKTKQDN